MALTPEKVAKIKRIRRKMKVEAAVLAVLSYAFCLLLLTHGVPPQLPVALGAASICALWWVEDSTGRVVDAAVRAYEESSCR